MLILEFGKRKKNTAREKNRAGRKKRKQAQPTAKKNHVRYKKTGVRRKQGRRRARREKNRQPEKTAPDGQNAVFYCRAKPNDWRKHAKMREPGRKVVVFFCSLGTARAPKAYTIANALLEKNPHLRKRLELFHTGLTDGPINKPGRYFLKGTEEREAGFMDMHTIVPLDRDVQLTIRGLLKIHGGPQINTVEEHGIDGDNIDHEKMLALLEKIAATKETKPPEKHRFV